MVRVGPEKVRRALARVAMVDQNGEVLLDRWVRPEEPVTDYRTPWSGVRAADLEGPLVLELADAQALVAGLLQGRLLVGHSVEHDLEALRLEHPAGSTRDTAKCVSLGEVRSSSCCRYPPFMTGRGRSRKSQPLRKLAASELGLHIQEGEHSPVEDARAAMKLYLLHRAVREGVARAAQGEQGTGEGMPSEPVALDCEMVGLGPRGCRSAVARVAVVDQHGEVLLDRWPAYTVVAILLLPTRGMQDDLEWDEAGCKAGKRLPGYRYQPLMQYSHTGCLKPRSLRKLAASELGLHIQEGEHSPVEDARAAMKLYLRHRAVRGGVARAAQGEQGTGE
ncbi:hypothetical protein QJQ45_025518, partial [Haematococcus lacustris]